MADSLDDSPKYLRLGDLEAYRIRFALSNIIWNEVISWPAIGQRTIGEQFIRSTDSVSANIAEGFGRYYKKDKIKFYRIARGSLFESLDWNEKARVRHLLTLEQHQRIFNELQRLPKSINALIKYTDSHLTI